MLELWRPGEGEGPTDSSEVCDFPAPLAQGLGEDCAGAAGLWMDGGKKLQRQNLINGNLSAPTSRSFSVSLQFWFMRVGGEGHLGERNSEHGAYVAPRRTLLRLDTIWGSHACGGRGATERSDYKWWPSHLEEQQVQASCGTSGWIDGWRIKGWMDGQDRIKKKTKNGHTVNAWRCWCAVSSPTCRLSLLEVWNQDVSQ